MVFNSNLTVTRKNKRNIQRGKNEYVERTLFSASLSLLSCDFVISHQCPMTVS